MTVLILLILAVAVTIAVQLKTGNSLVWWNGWHTREGNPVLFWSYVIPEVIVLLAAIWMLFGQVGRGG